MIALFSCSGGFLGGQYQEQVAKLDKIHGYCDNPLRNIKVDKREYKICKDKEMAAGADGLGASDEFNLPFVDDLLNNRKNNKDIVYTSNVNKYLWSGALNTLSNYTIKNIDSSGGYLETDWIYDSNNPDNERCAIKIQINSLELISTGVETSIVCQNKINSSWVNTQDNYDVEEKQISLAVLASANKYLNEDLNKK